jgi:[ribosomal protein S5]-alanine N-acetyltransferase
MEVFPELNTNRLILRKMSVDDLPSLVKYANNRKIADRILNMPYPFQEPDAVFRIGYVHQGFKNKTRYVFAIILKESRELIGEVSLHVDRSKEIAQLAYWVGEPFWNKGLSTEASSVVLDFGFEQLHLHAIYAECLLENKASQKVLLNNGMIKSGYNGSVVQYRLTKQECDERRRASR